MTRDAEWALVRAATPGSWEARQHGPLWSVVTTPKAHTHGTSWMPLCDFYRGVDKAPEQVTADAAFIAHFNPARVAELLEEVERLQRRVNALEDAMNPQDVCDVDAALEGRAALGGPDAQ